VCQLIVRLRAFRRDAAGATAVEFAFVGLIFITLLLGIIQFALVFMAQMYLHDAVSDAATGRTAGTYAGNRAQVVTQICARLIAIDNCGSNLLVENQPLNNYPTAAQEISGAVFATPAIGTPMLIRARVPVVTFVPGFPTLRVSATALYARLQ
jgi:Flp pilus assembly protein TadG